MLLMENLFLAFQDIPKTASTTLFDWLYRCISGRSFFDPGEPGAQTRHIHGFFWSGSCPGVRSVTPETALEEVTPDTFVFAVTRDPIRRFLSMYANRIHHHGDLSRDGGLIQKLSERGLSTHPELNEFVDHLEAYAACDKNLFHHVRPMVDFLGPRLDLYTRIVDISELEKLIEDIKAHWRMRGLAGLADAAPPLGRLQTGGVTPALSALTAESFSKLLDYYEEDYAALPSLNRRHIEDAYMALRSGATSARDEAEDTPVVELVPPPEGLVKAFWVNAWPSTDGEATSRFHIGGVLLFEDETRRVGWRLVVSDDRGQHDAIPELSSPKLAMMYPGDERATHARFEVEEIVFPGGSQVLLSLLNPQGEEICLAKIRRGQGTPD